MITITSKHVRVFKPEYLTSVLAIISKPATFYIGRIEHEGKIIPRYLTICEVDKFDNSTIVQGTITSDSPKEEPREKDFACSVQPRIPEDPDSDISMIFMCCDTAIIELVSQAITELITKPKTANLINEG